MPLLFMRSFPETLLDQSCRMAVRRQIEYAADRGVPWGISESAYNLVDRHGNYQYKAFGVPGLGLKRGLGDELVVAPYATALAAVVDPTEAVRNLRRLAGEGLEGAYGYYDAIDYTHGKTEEPESAGKKPARPRGNGGPGLHGPSPGDDPGGPGQRPPRRSDGEALPRRPAGAGHGAAAAGARAAPRAHHPAATGRGDPRDRPAARAGRPPLPVAAHDVSSRAVPVQRQLHRRRDERGRRRQLLSRPRGHEASGGSDPRPGEPVPLSARRAERLGVVGDVSSPPRRSRTTTWSRSSRRRRPSAAATTTSPPSSTSRSRPRTTSRCGAWR